MSVPGGHDETVRVLWINEYREKGRNLIGSWARAVKEYEKAARAQKKSNDMMIQSAEEAAMASTAQQKAERDRLVEFRKLSMQEYNLRRSHNAKMSALRKAQEKETLLEAKASEIAAAAEAKRQKSSKEIATAKQREMRDKRADAQNDIEDIKKIGQAEIAALKEQRTALKRESAKKSTTIDRKKEITGERKALQTQINERQDLMTDDVAARAKQRNSEIEELKNEMNERIAVIKASGKGEREALQQELEKTTKLRGVSLAQQREHVKKMEAEVAASESKLKRLETLRTELGSVEKSLRKGGVSADDDTISRVSIKAQRELHRQEREVSAAQFQIKRYSETLRNEMTSAGQVSAQTFEKLRDALNRSGVSQQRFNELTHAGGIHIKNFETEKTREIVALKKNTDQLGSHNNRMQQTISSFKKLTSNLRITGNGFRLLRVAIAGLLLPTLATAVSILVQAITTLVGGATALTAALAPLAGQVAGLAPLAFSAAQAFGVWSLAMTHLGTSSTTVGRLISTSLTGSAQAFQTMLKQLPKEAQGFAIQIRQNLFPAIDKLRTELQKKLFPAISDAIRFAAPGFRGMNKILVGTASAIGNVIRQIGGRIGSPAWARDLQTIGKNTNRWIRELTPALLHLVDAFRNLAIAAAPVVDHFVHLTNVFAHWIAIQAGYGRVSGNLTRFFKESNKVLDTTLSLFGNLGKAFLNVGRIAANVLGNQMLRDIRGQTVALNKWTSQGKNVQKMTVYFKELKAPLYEIGRLARDLFKAFFQVTNNQEFFKIINKLRTEALPALVELLKNVNKSFAPAVINLITNIFKTLSAVGQQGAFTTFVDILNGIVVALRFIAQSPVLGFMLKLVAAFAGLRFAANGIALLTRNFVGLGRALGLSVFQAGALNRELASRGLVGFRAPAAVSASDAAMAQGPVTPVQFGSRGRTVNVPERAISNLEGTTIMTPSASQEGAMVSQRMTRTLAEQEAAAQQVRLNRSLFSRNAGAIGGVAGIGLVGAGLATGGRTGSILTGSGIGVAAGASLGAAIGTTGAPIIGTAIGAIVGGLGAFAISLTHTKSAIDKLGESAQKTAEQVGGGRRKLQDATQDLRPAVLARDESRRNLAEQAARLRVLRRTPGMQGQVEQQQFAVKDAAEVAREARGRVRKDLETIRTFGPLVTKGRKTFLDQLLGSRDEFQKRIDHIKRATQDAIDVLHQRRPPDMGEQVRDLRKSEKKDLGKALDDWKGWLKEFKDGADGPISHVAGRLTRLATATHDLTSKKRTMNIELKLFGPSAKILHLLKLAQAHVYITPQQIEAAFGKAGGGRIPGAYVAADTVPALLSPGEFVVTGSGEQMLEQMTGMPGVLDYVGAMQRPHFGVGGRTRRFRRGGAVTPYNTQGVADDAIRSALGGGSYGDAVAQAIDAATSAMAGIDTSTQSASGISKKTPKGLREKMTRMIAEAGGLLGEHLLSAPGVVPHPAGFIQKDEWRKSKYTHKTGVDPGAAISDILRAGVGKFPITDVKGLFSSGLLGSGKSKYVSVYLSPLALSEPGYGASIMIGTKGFGFSGDRFTRRDQAPQSTQMLPFHVKGLPLRAGGRVRFRTGGAVDDLGMWEYDEHHRRRRRPHFSTGVIRNQNVAAQLRALRDEQAQTAANERARRMAFRFARPRETTVKDFKNFLEFATGYRELAHPGRDPLGAAFAALSIVPAGRFARLGRLATVGRDAERMGQFGKLSRADKITSKVLERHYRFHGTTADAGRSIADEKQIVSSSELLRRAGRPNFGLDQAYAGTYDIASHFIGRAPRTEGSLAFVRLKDLPKGQQMTSEIFRSKSAIPVKGVVHGVSSETGLARTYGRYLRGRAAEQMSGGAAKAAKMVRDRFGLYPPWGAFGIGSKAYRADRKRWIAEAGPFSYLQELKEAFHGPDSLMSGNPNSTVGLARWLARRIASMGGHKLGGRVPFRGGGRVRFQTGGFADRHNLLTQAAQSNSVRQSRQMDAERHNLVVLAGKARMAAEAALAAANKASDTADRALTNSRGGGDGGGGGNGGSAGPQFANAPTEFGLAAQARQRLALTSFANNVKDNSISSLSGLASNIKDELKRMAGALSAAQLAGKAKLADKIQAQMTVIQSRLQIVMDAVGNVINQLARQIQKSADKITAIQDRLQNRLLISGVDPAGMAALKMTQKAQNQIVKQDQMQLKMVKKQLADLRAVGAPQDVLDQYVQAVAAARQALNDAIAEAIVGRRAILRRKFERRETRAGFKEQMAELKLANIQTQAQIAGAFDGGAGQSAAFINSSIIPAIRKEIAAVEATLAHAKKLKLTEDEKNAKLIQLQELQNQLSQMQLEAQQDANAMLAKTLGKLSFEFQSQSFSDMIGSGTGI